MTIIRKNPVRTRGCDHPTCGEIIYRDTIDKDEAWAIEQGPGKRPLYFCTQECASMWEHEHQCNP